MAVPLILQKPVPAGFPANAVNLATFGGVPGATRAAMISAFGQAYDALEAQGGGILDIDPGEYDFGAGPDQGNFLIGRVGLANICIRGYGATLSCATDTLRSGAILSFMNPSNIAIMGLAFHDRGYDRAVEWKGAKAIETYCTAPTVGFKVIDVEAESCVAMFYSGAEVGSYYSLSGVEVSGWATNCYYGVDSNQNCSGTKVDIVCHNVRRALIAYGSQNWDVRIASSADAQFIGSNGLVDFIAQPGYTCDNIKIDLHVSGYTPYSSLFKLYGQGDGVSAYNHIRACVRVANAIGDSPLFETHHASSNGVEPTTGFVFADVDLTGSIAGSYDGPIILNSSQSTDPSTQIRLSRAFFGLNGATALPSYYSFFTPPDMRARGLLTF